MRSPFLYVASGLFSLIPSTRLFGLKRALLRACGAFVGPRVSINSGIKVLGTGELHIGGNTWLGIASTFIVPEGAKITLGENCDIGPEVLFESGSHEIGTSERRAGRGVVSDIVVGDGVWIGCRATILGGARISNGCLVAAGALILPGYYPPNSMIQGIPGKVTKELDS